LAGKHFQKYIIFRRKLRRYPEMEKILQPLLERYF
jgi:hypothetical protein